MNKKLLAIAATLFTFLPNSYAATTFTWGIDDGLTHQISVAKEFSKTISKLTRNRVKIKIKTYHISESHKYLYGIKNGDLDINQNLMTMLYQRQPRLKIWEYPFLFESPEHVESYMATDEAKDLLAGLETQHELPIDFTYAGGFLFFRTPMLLNTLSDLKGIKCYYDDTYVFFKDFLSPLGAIRNTKESQTCSEELSSQINVNKITHVNHLTLTWHRVITRILRVSKKKLSKLRKKDRDLMVSELQKITKKERDSVYREKDLMTAIIKSRGLEVREWSLAKRKSEFKKIKHLGKKVLPEIKKDVAFIKSIAPSKQKRPLKMVAK